MLTFLSDSHVCELKRLTPWGGKFPAEKLAPQRTRAPWGVPDEALLQQKVGGWTARR